MINQVFGGIIDGYPFVYDSYSDTVNTAARMESHGETGKIHVTDTAWTGHDLSLRVIQFVERGEMTIKGKGTMKTYFFGTK